MRFPCRLRLIVPLLAVITLAMTFPAGRICPSRAAPSRPEPLASRRVFTDITQTAGFTHTHQKPTLDHKLDNIRPWVSSVGAAAAAGDYDNDGWCDLYVTNSEKGTPNFLYHNNGDGTFTDVARQAGVASLNGEEGTSMACIWGDYDNDGWSDLYVVRWGRDVLLRNNGNGTFTDVTRKCFHRRDGSPGTDWANGNAAVFFDYNLDGRLDIYVGNYFDEIDLWHLKSTRMMHDDFETARNGGRNFLYRQEPNGTFTEVAASLGLDDPGWTLAVGSGDINNDGWPDLYCANDFGPDQLFLNRRDGSFENISEKALGGDSKKGMNVDFGDFDNDGWLDMYVSNITTAEYLQEGNMLWHNDGPDAEGTVTFTDVSMETSTYDGGWGWGAKFFDYDNDGDEDIIAVNGFISAGEGNYWYDLASWTVTGQDPADAANWPAIGDRSFSGYEPSRIFRNDGVGSFTEHARDLGVDDTRDGRGIVVFDYDNDGDLDLYIANQGQPPNLYRNDSPHDLHWLGVRLTSAPNGKCNRDAIGARVTLVTAQGMQIRERNGGNGYSGQSDPRLHFGLGGEDHVQFLDVRWPDGGHQILENVSADQMVQIRQDPSRYSAQAAVEPHAPMPRTPRDGSMPRPPPRPDAAEVDRQLSLLEQEVRLHPADHALASTYRLRSSAYAEQIRSIRFFEELVEKMPGSMEAKIQLSCAYVDKIPTCGGMAAVVSKGRLARKGLDQLDQVLAEHDDLWLGYYCRGMNHLHWPRALRHSDDAVVDLIRCLDLQKLGDPRPYYVRTYVALGDAHAKAGHDDMARRTWREGAARFPESAELQVRLALEGDDAILKYVESQRSLERPIDTDLSFVRDQPQEPPKPRSVSKP